MFKPPLFQWLENARNILLPPTARSDVWQEYRLARYLGLSTRELAGVRLGPRYHYRSFKIQKPDGRERRILAPSPALKKLQRQLLAKYLSTLKIHPAATAFFPGASIAGNARRHAGRALIATADLADFFESTSADRVRSFFVKEGWRDEPLSTLMRLCVYRGGLPQGAPTSPCLSNLVNVELDEALSAIAGRNRAWYTRYGDDLIFSWRTENVSGDFQAIVTDCVRYFGYEIQSRKGWTWKRLAEKPEITGVVIGRWGQLRASDRVRNEARRAWWQWIWRGDEATEARLRGYEGYMKMLDGE
jgi:hypothetical protein